MPRMLFPLKFTPLEFKTGIVEKRLHSAFIVKIYSVGV